MQQDKHQLSKEEEKEVLECIKDGKTIPKKLLYKMSRDDEDVFLFWNGRKEEVTNAVLPFHSIEHIDEPRKEKEGNQGALFDMDGRGRQKSGWTNKLIWGDNKLIMSSLLNGPMREEIEKQGGIKLIYIDPPFASDQDFSFDIEINSEEVTKKQSILEERAYYDTWGRGISSYLSMMYERLKLMHSLLADDGSIYVHCDWRVSGYLRMVLDEIFGKDSYRNEIVWTYQGSWVEPKTYFPRRHNSILFYKKNNNEFFNRAHEDNADDQVNSKRWSDYIVDNKIYGKHMPDYDLRFKPYLEKFKKEHSRDPSGDDIVFEAKGSVVGSVWNIKTVDPKSPENVNYPTQKSEKLLERIIKASSNEGDLVADFFCGSGTTGSVAEKLNRKWIMSDLGRFAIHTTRKRMINIQRELKKEGNQYRAFEILNLGKYERRYFLEVNTELSEEEQKTQQKQKYNQYIELILNAYRAQPIDGMRNFHGKKGDRFVYVGPIDVPVTKAEVEELFKECKEKGITKADVLGFEFEMGIQPYVKQEMEEKGVNFRLKNIPREVFDKQAVERGQVNFFDTPYLEAQTKVDGKKVNIELINFVTDYTQDDLEKVEQNLRKGSSRVVIEGGEIVKIEKDKNGKVKRETLTKKWIDWIDYWAVDFNYEHKKEIIQVGGNGEAEEVWTGNYIFENEWQSFRTKKNNEIDLESIKHTYEKSGTYKIAVRVVDILGQDTLQTIKIKIK